MKQITLDESKKIQLDILQHIHDFCIRSGIRYSICGGTLIGAIRHKGFIPWDDDIDIFMLREDYTKFIESYSDYRGIYILHSLETDSSYEYPYAKVEDSRTYMEEDVTAHNMGIAIDIFPVDNCYDTEEASLVFINNAKLKQRLYKGKLVRPTENNSFATKCRIMVAKAFTMFYSLRKLAENLSAYSQGGQYCSKYVATIVSGYGVRELQLREAFNDIMIVPFEDRSFMALRGYDKYLRIVYGNYMELPPQDKQRSPHIINGAYWKD